MAASTNGWPSRRWWPPSPCPPTGRPSTTLCHGPWTLAYFTNLFNFSDGIDCLAGVGAVGIDAGATAVAALATPPRGPWYGLAIAGAALGYLAWNWYPARIFLGDVGSAPRSAIYWDTCCCASRPRASGRRP